MCRGKCARPLKFFLIIFSYDVFLWCFLVLFILISHLPLSHGDGPKRQVTSEKVPTSPEFIIPFWAADVNLFLWTRDDCARNHCSCDFCASVRVNGGNAKYPRKHLAEASVNNSSIDVIVSQNRIAMYPRTHCNDWLRVRGCLNCYTQLTQLTQFVSIMVDTM